jgi:uncharacterized membrane protein
MNKERLHALSDGIFAIVLTLLVLEIRVPELTHSDNAALISALAALAPTFAAFTMSFAALFVYWRAHNFIVSDLAKGLDAKLVNYNGLFLFFVSLLPFGAHFYGRYYLTQVGVMVYAVNLICIGLSLYAMREHIVRAAHIETAGHWGKRDLRNGTVRMLFPVISAIVAVLVSFLAPVWSLGIFLVALLFSLSNHGIDIFNAIFQLDKK